MTKHAQHKQTKEHVDELNPTSSLFLLTSGLMVLSFLIFLTYSKVLGSLLFLVVMLFLIASIKKKQIIKLFNKFKFWLKIRKIQKKSQNINHSLVLLAKQLNKIPMRDDEDEVTSFNDVKDWYGDKWPFMLKVEHTQDPKVALEGKRVKCISSYSYLEYTSDERVQNAAIEAAKAYSTGNHGPRMLCGNLLIIEQLESKIAEFYRKDAALVFSSGYLACMSTVAGITRKGDLLLMDKLSHASLKAGAKLCGVPAINFKHNDFEDAERLIKKHKPKKGGKIVMVIEGIYSMDGDVGFLDKARKLCDKYGAILILDEAHSLGSIGKTGRGTEEMYDWEYKADIICGTFSKSIASVGGFLACSRRLREFYTFYGSGLVFSAPISAYHAGAALKSFELIDKEPERIQDLQDKSEYLRNKLTENGFNIGVSISCVIPVIFRDINQSVNIHRWLLNKGYFAALVMAPACAVDAPRFRVTVTAKMTKQELDDIVTIFKQAREENPETEELKELLENL